MSGFVLLTALGMLMSATVAFPPLGRCRDRIVARCATDAFLIRHSLWDECDGEPMNEWAQELYRRDLAKESA